MWRGAVVEVHSDLTMRLASFQLWQPNGALSDEMAPFFVGRDIMGQRISVLYS